ncbi:hypothetical protein CEXT_212391 [Caerostris extrusa]|uniref:Uncharacterized protein n=1 Tax=Caerostris extrusa TaxID=172846 RepID=A0AAV4PC69_CAEEX|nr:hypothetical protein CEXT_212391 [Caerostris extrusa]
MLYIQLPHKIDDEENIWTFGYSVFGERYHLLMDVIGSYAYFVVATEKPYAITFSVCILIEVYSIMLAQFSKSIENAKHGTLQSVRLIKDYKRIEKSVQLLKKICQ